MPWKNALKQSGAEPLLLPTSRSVEDELGFGNIIKSEEAAPKNYGAVVSVGFAVQKASKLSNPSDGLVDGGWLSWRQFCLMNKAVECFPLMLFKKATCRGIGRVTVQDS